MNDTERSLMAALTALVAMTTVSVYSDPHYCGIDGINYSLQLFGDAVLFDGFNIKVHGRHDLVNKDYKNGPTVMTLVGIDAQDFHLIYNCKTYQLKVNHKEIKIPVEIPFHFNTKEGGLYAVYSKDKNSVLVLFGRAGFLCTFKRFWL